MAANYSTNPTNPANQAGGQPQGQVQPPAPAQTQPKSIRDYVKLARSQGQAPSFTNVPGGQGYQMGEAVQPQAISEGPQSQYEKMPFAQRMKVSPYVRAQERLRLSLPELWEQVFPGRDQAAYLEDYEKKAWGKAVEGLTSNLLKHYDKQYEWSLKNEASTKKTRHEDRRFWQAKYAGMASQSNPPIDQETGMPIPESEWVEQRISAGDEMKFKDDMAEKDRGNAGLASVQKQQIKQVLQGNPDVGRSVKFGAMKAVSESFGREISEGEFDAMRSDPETVQQLNEAIIWSLEQHEQEIMNLM